MDVRDAMISIKVVGKHLEVLNIKFEDGPMHGAGDKAIFLPHVPQ